MVDETPKGDVLHVIGYLSAKVGDGETYGTTRRFGLGERHERGVSSCMQGGCIHGDRRTKPLGIKLTT